MCRSGGSWGRRGFFLVDGRVSVVLFLVFCLSVSIVCVVGEEKVGR